MQWQHWQIDSERLEQLLRRTEAMRPLLRRDLEEEITKLVALPSERLSELLEQFRQQHQLGDDAAEATWLEQRGWSADDLQLHLARPEALDRFAQQRFGPGVEETFLQRKPELDTVVYSLLRVQDRGLAQELWIQLSEGEISFPEAASRHSDGPEANTKGVIGPVALGQLQPELADRLRTLRQGELREPITAGQWWILLRLEQLTPAKLDDAMRHRLLQEQLNTWLEQRCDAVLRGDRPDPLHYDPQP
jgi:parvulin-like peptidyl-prolyl isomerase